jgi:hypothetical protein
VLVAYSAPTHMSLLLFFPSVMRLRAIESNLIDSDTDAFLHSCQMLWIFHTTGNKRVWITTCGIFLPICYTCVLAHRDRVTIYISFVYHGLVCHFLVLVKWLPVLFIVELMNIISFLNTLRKCTYTSLINLPILVPDTFRKFYIKIAGATLAT